MTQRIVLIESNTSGTGRKFVAAARSVGIDPILIAKDPGRYPYVALDNVETVCEDASDIEALKRTIDSIGEEVVGVYSSSEYFIEAAAELARSRQLPGPDPEAVRVCRNKWMQRVRLRDAQIGSPNFKRAVCPEDALRALDELGLPVVAKPRKRRSPPVPDGKRGRNSRLGAACGSG